MKTQWMAIETAPRDGTPFLAWIDGFKEPAILIYDADEYEFCAHDTHVPYKGPSKPTNWMPLPEPPDGNQSKMDAITSACEFEEQIRVLSEQNKILKEAVEHYKAREIFDKELLIFEMRRQHKQLNAEQLKSIKGQSVAACALEQCEKLEGK